MLKVTQDRPEEFLGEVRVAFLVGVGEAVFGRWSASSKSKRNGEREASDKSFKIFKRERVVTPLPF
jgi:hypothetical protein